MTIQGLLDQCARCQTHPATYNFSYVTEQTFRGVLTGFHYPEPGMNPFMIPTALYIGHKKFDKPVYSGFRASDWWHNDGLVSVYSQMFPRIAGSHPVGGAIGSHTRREQVLLGQNRVDELVRQGLESAPITRVFDQPDRLRGVVLDEVHAVASEHPAAFAPGSASRSERHARPGLVDGFGTGRQAAHRHGCQTLPRSRKALPQALVADADPHWSVRAYSPATSPQAPAAAAAESRACTG